MKEERFKSKTFGIYLTTVAVGFAVLAGDYTNWTQKDFLEAGAIAAALFFLVVYLRITTYLEIQNGRMLINSGYRTFGKDVIDIRDIKYVYRHPELILKWYGSRMIFYIKGNDGKLRQSSLREANYSRDTLIRFLKRIKQIKATIELDPEYETILKGSLEFSDASANTLKSVEERLRQKGETWG